MERSNLSPESSIKTRHESTDGTNDPNVNSSRSKADQSCSPKPSPTVAGFLSIFPFRRPSNKPEPSGSLLDLLDEGWFSGNVAWPPAFDLSTIKEEQNETDEDAETTTESSAADKLFPASTATVSLTTTARSSREASRCCSKNPEAGTGDCLSHSQSSELGGSSGDYDTERRSSAGCGATDACCRLSEPAGSTRSNSPEPEVESSFGKYRRRRGRTGARRRSKRSSSVDALEREGVRGSPRGDGASGGSGASARSFRIKERDPGGADLSGQLAAVEEQLSQQRHWREWQQRFQEKDAAAERSAAFRPPPSPVSRRGGNSSSGSSGSGNGFHCNPRSSHGNSGYAQARDAQARNGGVQGPVYMRTRSVSDYQSREYEGGSSLSPGVDYGEEAPPPLCPRTRSLTEADVEELRGFVDLGFKFRQEDIGPRITATLPALRLYQAVGSVQQRLIHSHRQHVSAAGGAVPHAVSRHAAGGPSATPAASSSAATAESACASAGAAPSGPAVSPSLGNGCFPVSSSPSPEPEHRTLRGGSMPSSPRHHMSVGGNSSSTVSRRGTAIAAGMKGSISSGGSSYVGSMDDSWSFANPHDHPADVKTHLRLWAQAVASTVRQTC